MRPKALTDEETLALWARRAAPNIKPCRTSPFGNGAVRRGSCSTSALLTIESLVWTRLRYGYAVLLRHLIAEISEHE